MTSSLQARDAHRILRILCKHFGKLPGQTLPLRWLALEWASEKGLSVGGGLTHTTQKGLDQSGSHHRSLTETDLLNAIDHAIQSGWLRRHVDHDSDEILIELTQAGYKWQSDREAINASGKNVPRELLKLLKKKVE